MFNKKGLIILVIIFLVFGCNINSPSLNSGSVVFNLSLQAYSRTILFNLSSADIEQLRIDFISGPVEFESKYLSMNKILSLELLFGDWVLDLYGLNSDGNEIAYSHIEFSVVSAATIFLDVDLRALSQNVIETDASGIVDIILDWSSVDDQIKNEVQSVSASFGAVGGAMEDISTEVDFEVSLSRAIFNRKSCISGNFIMEFNLLNFENMVISSTSEAVNVRDFLSTSGTITLQDEDFNIAGVNFNISVEVPELQNITFNYPDDSVFTSVDLSSGIEISVTNTTTYDNYLWSLNGEQIASNIESVDLPNDISTGINHLTVFVEKDGVLFSETFRFIVKE